MNKTYSSCLPDKEVMSNMSPLGRRTKFSAFYDFAEVYMPEKLEQEVIPPNENGRDDQTKKESNSCTKSSIRQKHCPTCHTKLKSISLVRTHNVTQIEICPQTKETKDKSVQCQIQDSKQFLTKKTQFDLEAIDITKVSKRQSKEQMKR